MRSWRPSSSSKTTISTVTSRKNNSLRFDTEGKENPYLTIMTAVLGTAAELERQSIYYRLKSGRDKYIRDGGKVGKPKGAGIKDNAQLASEYKSIIRCLRSGESVRHTALITGYSQSTVQRVKKVFSL